MKWINRKAQSLKQGKIRDMFDRAAGYEGVISLGIGEPDMATPKAICEAARRAMEEGRTHYTPNAGTLSLRTAIAESEMMRRFGYRPEKEIVITTGGMGALSLCLQVVLDPGDEALIQDPQWLNYVAQVRYADGVAVRVPAGREQGFVLTAKEIERKITANTKVLLINSPNNPTGRILGHQEMEKIAKVAIDRDLLVISDEVYQVLRYDGKEHESIAGLPGMRDRTVIVNSFSKAFAMTGWRVGYAAGPEEIIDKMVKLQENFNSCPSSVGQYAAEYALGHMELAEEMRGRYEKRRAILMEGLNQLPGIRCTWPEGAFYAFADISSFGISSEEFCGRLLEEQRVVCIPGSAFGDCGEGFIRLSYANGEKNLEEALRRMETFVGSLAGHSCK